DSESEIKYYNQSFRRLSNRKNFKSIAEGYVRKFEITYNKK
ncbi:replication protein, partial [Staphylococcus pseudintermedius]